MMTETGVVFRGVIKISGDRHIWDTKTQTFKVLPGPNLIYSRPYNTMSPAKSAVTKMRKSHTRSFLDGWVEYSTEWKRLDED